MPTSFLFDGPEDARVTILLAHGAGAPMDSASMNATAKALAAQGFRVARFEFGSPEEIATYTLSPSITVRFLEDGDHDLKPRKALSGFSTGDHLKTIAQSIDDWTQTLTK